MDDGMTKGDVCKKFTENCDGGGIFIRASGPSARSFLCTFDLPTRPLLVRDAPESRPSEFSHGDHFGLNKKLAIPIWTCAPTVVSSGSARLDNKRGTNRQLLIHMQPISVYSYHALTIRLSKWSLSRPSARFSKSKKLPRVE
jgi:hypothetical protein